MCLRRDYSSWLLALLAVSSVSGVENLPFPLTCQAALPDRKGQIWAGTGDGLMRIESRGYRA